MTLVTKLDGIRKWLENNQDYTFADVEEHYQSLRELADPMMEDDEDSVSDANSTSDGSEGKNK